MTKNSPKKVYKNTQRPNRTKGNYEIIKHFEPSERNNACRTNLLVEIPQLHANIDNDGMKPRKKVFAPPERKPVIQIPHSYGTGLPIHTIINNKAQSPPKYEKKNVLKLSTKHNFKSSSSSSLEGNLEKFTSKLKTKSKSFNSGQSKKSDENNKVIKTSREQSQSPRVRSGGLNSVTDSALIRKELNLKSLKQEILGNKRSTSLERKKFTSYSSNARGLQVQNLRDEVNKLINKDQLHRKILVAELKTEIAEFKRFNTFQVYNTHSSSSPKRSSSSHKGDNVSQNSQNSAPKSPKKTSISKDGSVGKNSVKTSEQDSLNRDHGKSNPNILPSGTPRKTSLVQNHGVRRNSRRESDNFNTQMDTSKKDSWWQDDLGRDKEQSLAGTETKGSINTPDVRSSSATIEEPCMTKVIPKVPPFSDTESLDDSVIRNKIHEANQLIARVKQALDKMKQTKAKKESVETPRIRGENSTSSSTDIEETLENLTKETERLITSDSNKPTFEQDPKRSKTRRCCRDPVEKPSPSHSSESISKIRRKDGKKEANTSSSSSSRSKASTSQRERKQYSTSSDESNEEIESKSIPISRPCFEKDSEEDKTPETDVLLDCIKQLDKLGLERPVTRRGEIEDVAEEIITDKFRNCPEDGQIPVTSSLEELQAKLQTISESTESSFSTPRNKSSENPVAVKEVRSFCCNTYIRQVESKEIQVEQEKKDVEILCINPSENKGTQTAPETKKYLTTSITGIESLMPRPKLMETITLENCEIPPNKSKCERCQVETLPIVQVPPFQQQTICEKCKKNLKEEHLEGVSIPPKMNKLQKLTIKLLPPIIINQQMTVKQVLNFSITQQGETENLLKETQNAVFIVVKRPSDPNLISEQVSAKEGSHSTLNEGFHSTLNEDSSKFEEGMQTSEDRLGQEEMEVETYLDKAICPKEPEFRSSFPTSRANSGKLEPKPRNSKFFLKLRNEVVRNLDLADELAADPCIPDDVDEETKKKLLFYKSYNLYDNQNRHDPGGLDQESAHKISGIDLNFYKTFINPTGKISETDMPFRSRTTITWGFESKGVQCEPESLIITQQASDATTKTKMAEDQENVVDEKKSNVKKLHVRTPKESNPSMKVSHAKMDPPEESQVTVLKIKTRNREAARPMKSADPPISSALSMNPVSSTEYNTTPSSITVTISYSQSSEEGYPHCEDRNNMLNMSREIELNTTNLDLNIPSTASEIQSQAKAQPNLETNINLSEIQQKSESNNVKAIPEAKLESTNFERTIKSALNLTGAKRMESTMEHRLLTVKDKDVILKLHEKLKTVNPEASDAALTIDQESNTVQNFIQGLTRINTKSNLNIGMVPDPDATSEGDSQNVNYHLIETDLDSGINLYSKHLRLAKNGRYQDEENLFTQHPHPKLNGSPKCISNSSNLIDVSPKSMDSPLEPFQQDKEVQMSGRAECPRRRFGRYSPDTTNSDTVTTNSLSEGEVRCRHSVSNGEIHVCRHGIPHYRTGRNVLQRSTLTRTSLSPCRRVSIQRNILSQSNLTNLLINMNRDIPSQPIVSPENVTNSPVNLNPSSMPNQRLASPPNNIANQSANVNNIPINQRIPSINPSSMPNQRIASPPNNIANQSANVNNISINQRIPSINPSSIPNQRIASPPNNIANQSANVNNIPINQRIPSINPSSMPNQRIASPPNNIANQSANLNNIPINQRIPSPRNINSNMQSQRVIPRNNVTRSPTTSPTRQTPRNRSIYNRSNLTIRPTPSPNRGPSSLRNFNLTDPNITIEKRRNYFNNWVTYYVKTQELNDSSTSSCSHNK